MLKKWKALICLEFLQRNIMNHYTHYMSIFVMKQNLVLALSELLTAKGNLKTETILYLDICSLWCSPYSSQLHLAPVQRLGAHISHLVC